MNIPKTIEACYTVRVDREDDDATDVTCTLDMTLLSEEDIMSYALDSIIILAQGKQRRDALKKKGAIPIQKSWTFHVQKPGMRQVASASSKLVKVFGADKTEKLIEKYGSAEAALEAVKALVD